MAADNSDKNQAFGAEVQNGFDAPPIPEGSQQGVPDSQKETLLVEYPNRVSQILITIGLMLGMFLVRCFSLQL